MCFVEHDKHVSDDFSDTCTGWADRRRPPRQEMVDLVLRLCDALPAGDRQLLEASFRDGKNAVELAALMGLGPRSVRRRIARLTRRVLSPEYRYVLSQRDAWPPPRRRVATEIFINGRSARAASRALRISLHTARRHHAAVVAMFEAVRAAQTAIERAVRP
jgi:hypothetical protein